jgi:hypothetical protein
MLLAFQIRNHLTVSLDLVERCELCMRESGDGPSQTIRQIQKEIAKNTSTDFKQ